MSRTDKPVWPNVKEPYLIPSQLMFWGLSSAIITTPIGLSGLGHLSFWLGLLAFVHAYRKRHVMRAAEKAWWRDFRARYPADPIHSRSGRRMNSRVVLAILAAVFLVLGFFGLLINSMAVSPDTPVASLVLLILGTGCVAFLAQTRA